MIDKNDLPEFLYENSAKEICTGVHGDTDVTDLWNDFVEKQNKKELDSLQNYHENVMLLIQNKIDEQKRKPND